MLFLLQNTAYFILILWASGCLPNYFSFQTYFSVTAFCVTKVPHTLYWNTALVVKVPCEANNNQFRRQVKVLCVFQPWLLQFFNNRYQRKYYPQDIKTEATFPSATSAMAQMSPLLMTPKKCNHIDSSLVPLGKLSCFTFWSLLIQLILMITLKTLHRNIYRSIPVYIF